MNPLRLLRPALAVLAATGLAAALVAAPSANRLNLDPDIPALIDVAPVAERWDGEGFMPLRVRIENRAADALAWTFDLRVNLGYSGHTLTHQVRLGAGAGEVVETVVFVPGAGQVQNGNRASISITLLGPGSLGYAGHLLHGNNDQVIPTATSAALEGPLLTVTHGSPGTNSEITTIDPARWPADWRVWSPFDRVVLDEPGYASLDAARRAALLDWVAMGGTLDLYPSAGDVAPREPLRRHGHGAVRALPRPLQAEAAAVTGGAAKSAVTLARQGLEDLPARHGAQITPERRDSLQPVRGSLGVSLFLVAFGIVIGPVNLFVFAPSGRRHRLFITMPALSLGASVLLAGYIVIKDGFGGEGARHGLVLLLPETNQAVLTQIQIARSGVLLGEAFELPEDAMLSHAGILQKHAWQHGGDSPEHHFTRSDVRVGGDWFASRRMQEHTLRRLVPTRARVELVAGGKDGEPPVVQSSVGTLLKDFRYTDAEGRFWGAHEIAPGERVTLTPQPAHAGQPHGLFIARGGAAEGLAPLETLRAIRWDEPVFLYAGPLVGARTP